MFSFDLGILILFPLTITYSGSREFADLSAAVYETGYSWLWANFAVFAVFSIFAWLLIYFYQNKFFFPKLREAYRDPCSMCCYWFGFRSTKISTSELIDNWAKFQYWCLFLQSCKLVPYTWTFLRPQIRTLSSIISQTCTRIAFCPFIWYADAIHTKLIFE
jgi:hypothetical protein